jgi:hypothetical protein
VRQSLKETTFSIIVGSILLGCSLAGGHFVAEAADVQNHSFPAEIGRKGSNAWQVRA